MSIIVPCPTCGTKLRAPDDAAGKRLKCPKCQTIADVPGQGVAATSDVELIPVAARRETEPAVRLVAPGPTEVSPFDELDEAPRPRGFPLHSGLWIGLAGCALILGLAGIAGALWFAGVFDPKVGKQGNSQALAPRQDTAKAGQKETKSEPPPRPKLTEKQKALVTDAIKALGKIEAAVQVGVTYQQYGQLVIDAKAMVNEAARNLPSGELMTALTETIDAYKDASTVWSHKIQHPRLGLRKDFGHGEIIERYKLPVGSIPLYAEQQAANPDVALQYIWAFGGEKLTKARGLQ